VSSEEGDAGWVLTSKLTMDPQAAAADGGPRRRLIHLHGGLGLSVVSQSVATTGGANQPPDNYAATSPALGVSLGGTLLYPVGQRYWIGGELGYDFAYAVPGVSYNNQSTSVMVHDLDVRGIAGREFGANNKAVTVRLGYHFDSYQVSNTYDFTKNTAKVPNQIIQGPTIGLGLAIPRFTDKLAMTLAVDTMLFGSSVEQTKGLEDGTGPSATAFFVATGFVYRWKPKMSLELMLDLDYTAVSFTGMPPANPPGRGHTGTATSSGSDLSGGLTFGIVYAL
jgi:hypothetical protein